MRVLDLFSGIGGFSLGLERAGFETVAFCEIDPLCRAILSQRFPGRPIYGDVRKLYRFADEYPRCDLCEEPLCDLCEAHFADCDCVGCSEFDDDVGEIDVITAGFPCQDISLLNAIHGEGEGIDGEQSGLWSEAARLIWNLRPRYAILENVAALTVRGLGTVIGDLADCGYDCEWHCIPASHVGAEHRRMRIWIIAYPTGQRVEGLWPDWDGIAQTVDRQALSVRDSDGQWQVEPDVLRTPDGLSRNVDRLRVLGNAVVPQIPELIGRAILRHEAMSTSFPGGGRDKITH